MKKNSVTISTFYIGIIFFSTLPNHLAYAAITISGDTTNLINTSGNYTVTPNPIFTEARIGDTGTGSLIIDQGSVLTGGFAHIGSQTNSDGNVIITGSSSTWAPSVLYVGNLGNGALTIENSAQLISQSAIYIATDQGEGSVLIQGSGTLLEQTTDIMFVGNVGKGILTVKDGARLLNFNTHVGSGVGAEGTVIVSGAGTRWDSSNIRLGTNGAGSVGDLRFELGAQITSVHVTIPQGPPGGTSIGNAIITDIGTLWTITEMLSIGANGTGQVTVENGAILDASRIFIGMSGGNPSSNGNGSLIVNGNGTLLKCGSPSAIIGINIPGTNVISTVSGVLNVKNGAVVNCSKPIIVRTKGTVQGDGTLIGQYIHNGGTLKPGNPIGQLSIDGDFISDPGSYFTYPASPTNGEIRIEIGGTATGTYDSVAITGSADFVAGNVTFEFANDFLPTDDFSINFLTAADIIGATNLTYNFSPLLNALGSGWSFAVIDTGASLQLTSTCSAPTLGDINLDCKINQGDAILLMRYLLGLTSLSSTQQAQADIVNNGLTEINLGDYIALQKLLLF